ncbi:DNA mismatch repair protein MutS [Portibacter marinus]|uniref:DNA mismatch repair protein MutS n=1 Tax=Portibacter marinus TaxID=2898660 RepID=UPI001F40A056|nr:DNA mismatch repair protein MutS [Portibacter marinus]
MTKTAKVKKQHKQTPLMKQYFAMKAKYPDAILLFRVGDFYETFGEDAEKVANVLGIILTKRNNGGSDIPLAGFPYHSLDLYLPRLIKAGFRVAICEQLEKPSKEKKIVKRGVTEVITPGLTVDEKLLDHKNNNFLCAIHRINEKFGIAFLDLSTGEFIISQGNQLRIEKLIQSFQPSEIIFAKSHKDRIESFTGSDFYKYHLDEWIFSTDFATEKLRDHFKVQSLKGFGIEEVHEGQVAAGAILHYLESTENTKLDHINSISRIQLDEYVWLDRFTIRNLELVHSNHPTGIPLIQILDKTVSPMGSRMMRKWVLLPLLSVQAIHQRLSIVDFFKEQVEKGERLRSYLEQIGDLERLVAKISTGKIAPRELKQLESALNQIPHINELCNQTDQETLCEIASSLSYCEQVRDAIAEQIIIDPPSMISKGGVISEGVHEELDDLRHVVKNSKSLLAEIQESEAEKTGITNLKIGFNNVFGYYLEVTNKYKNQGLVPENWVRKQTLTGSERYITDELKKLETKILGAEEKILVIEEQIYLDLIASLFDYIPAIQKNAQVIAKLDCLQSLALVAEENNYCKPIVDESFSIDIKDGRHPVIEKHMEIGESYVPNDVFLDTKETQIMMITGPNMSGKSAILRQTALICLMAQMGSFVPASSARLGFLDKLFTRVGASDNISSGESTFMVEMNETASIMNNISDRSLILLDEIGRGTSTYDGISIAWSLAEYLYNNQKCCPKTLFATHYHELNKLADRYDRIKNYSVSTKEIGQKVIFLRKLIPGGSNHSFGIHVAQMAGMPRSVIARAQEILLELEQKSFEAAKTQGDISSRLDNVSSAMQLSIFETVDPTAGKLKAALMEVDIHRMTPIDCMMKLNELKKMMEE